MQRERLTFSSFVPAVRPAILATFPRQGDMYDSVSHWQNGKGSRDLKYARIVMAGKRNL